jgi:hypothetical protein
VTSPVYVELVAAADATADVDVRSTPPGATVWLADGPKGTTPVTLHPRLGEHTVRLTLDGYHEQAIELKLVRPGEAPDLEVVLSPSVATVSVTTTPPGADVSFDGISKGKSPVTVPGLEPGKAIVVQTTLKGHRPESRTITPPGGNVPYELEVPLEPTGKPAPTATPAGSAPPVKPLGPNMGHLSVEVLGGWGEVWVDTGSPARNGRSTS